MQPSTCLTADSLNTKSSISYLSMHTIGTTQYCRNSIYNMWSHTLILN